jgi:hypothetical protein
MRTRYLMGLFLALGMAAAMPLGFSQAAASAESRTTTAAEASAKQAGSQEMSGVRAGTKIDAELVSAIDAKTAKPGDRVESRVLKNVKQNGRVVVHKGDLLVGRVTQARADAAGKAGSQMNVAFDHLAGASGEVPLHTVLTSIISTDAEQQAQAGLGSDPMLESMPAGGAMGGGGGARGGGMLGGVGSAVGSTVGATAGAMGSVAGSAGSTVGNAGGTLGAATRTSAGAGSNLGLSTPLRAIHVQSSANAQNQNAMNSTLSTRHGDLRLDSGTRMQFRVAANSEGKGSQQR